MLDEYAMLGLCPDGHVMELLRPELGPELLGSRGGDVVRAAGRVVRRQRPLAAAVFLTLEDEYGLIPPRLADNWTEVDSYSLLYHWPNPWTPARVAEWIHRAFVRRDWTPPSNSRKPFARNRTRDFRSGWRD